MEESRRRWIGWFSRMTAGLVPVLPVLLACVFTQAIPSGQVMPQAAVREPIVFAQYAVNLREVPAEPIVSAHFDFWNRGEESVSITRLEPSCACLNPRLVDDKKIYRPGERGRFYVQVRTANEPPGPQEYAVRMLYKYRGKSLSRFLTFRLTIPDRKISVEPPQLVFYDLGRPLEPQIVYVKDYRGKPIQVTSVETSGPWVNATVGDREVDEQGELRIPILVEISDGVAPGKHLEVLKLRTNDPDYKTLSIPVFVFGATKRIGLVDGEEPSVSGAVNALHESDENQQFDQEE